MRSVACRMGNPNRPGGSFGRVAQLRAVVTGEEQSPRLDARSYGRPDGVDGEESLSCGGC